MVEKSSWVCNRYKVVWVHLVLCNAGVPSVHALNNCVLNLPWRYRYSSGHWSSWVRIPPGSKVLEIKHSNLKMHFYCEFEAKNVLNFVIFLMLAQLWFYGEDKYIQRLSFSLQKVNVKEKQVWKCSPDSTQSSIQGFPLLNYSSRISFSFFSSKIGFGVSWNRAAAGLFRRIIFSW
jgi:hypothetical protein